MPRLRAENIPPTRGLYAVPDEHTGDDVRLTCPEEGCDWTAVRPRHAVWSCQEAHRIGHLKGWYT